jgi:hypothetical protein
MFSPKLPKPCTSRLATSRFRYRPPTRLCSTNGQFGRRLAQRPALSGTKGRVPNWSSVLPVGRWDCSTILMISSFSDAGYLTCRCKVLCRCAIRDRMSLPGTVANEHERRPIGRMRELGMIGHHRSQRARPRAQRKCIREPRRATQCGGVGVVSLKALHKPTRLHKICGGTKNTRSGVA